MLDSEEDQFEQRAPCSLMYCLRQVDDTCLVLAINSQNFYLKATYRSNASCFRFRNFDDNLFKCTLVTVLGFIQNTRYLWATTYVILVNVLQLPSLNQTAAMRSANSLALYMQTDVKGSRNLWAQSAHKISISFGYATRPCFIVVEVWGFIRAHWIKGMGTVFPVPKKKTFLRKQPCCSLQRNAVGTSEADQPTYRRLTLRSRPDYSRDQNKVELKIPKELINWSWLLCACSTGTPN